MPVDELEIYFFRRTMVYQWSTRTIQTLTRPDWGVRGGVIDKTVHVMVTPRVKVR